MKQIDLLRKKYTQVNPRCREDTLRMIDKVYKAADKLQREQKDVTKRAIAQRIGVEVSTIQTPIKHLVEANYLKTSSGGSRTFMMVFDAKDNIEYLWTREEIASMRKNILKQIREYDQDTYSVLAKFNDDDSTFFDKLDEEVQKLWKQGHTDVKTMGFRKTANRYAVL